MMKRQLRFLKRKVTQALNLLPVSSKVAGTPRKCLNVAAYLDKHPDVQVYKLREEQQISLPLPRLNVKNTPAAYVSERRAPQQCVLQLFNGRVWGANGAVVTEDDTFLADLSREFGIKNPCRDHSIFHTVLLKHPKRINGNVAVVTSAGANVFYHWMLDILPRILMLKEVGVFESISHFVINYSSLPFQQQTLELLGISEDKILRSSNNWAFHIEAERLLVPTLPSLLNEVNVYECKLLQKYLLKAEISFKGPQRIYISRKQAATRTIVNEEELSSYLSNYGFEVIELEGLSIQQQIHLFNKAEIILGPHGSGFTNIVFSRAGTVLIDILPDTNIVSCFYNIAAQLGIKYFGFIDKGIPVNALAKNDNILLDLNNFSRFFENIVKHDRNY